MMTLDKQQIQILFTEEQISSKVEQLAKQISEDYKDCHNLVLVGVLKGAIMFVSDLARKLSVPCQLEFIRLSSYNREESTGEVKAFDLTLPNLEDMDVLIVEDIVDSGRTAKFLFEFFKVQSKAQSIKIVTLFDKKCRRIAELKDLTPDYCGFEIEDKFIVGYGLDYEQQYRELPYVGYIQD